MTGGGGGAAAAAAAMEPTDVLAYTQDLLRRQQEVNGHAPQPQPRPQPQPQPQPQPLRSEPCPQPPSAASAASGSRAAEIGDGRLGSLSARLALRRHWPEIIKHKCKQRRARTLRRHPEPEAGTRGREPRLGAEAA